MRHVAPLNATDLPTLADIKRSVKPIHRPPIEASFAELEAAYEDFDAAIPHNLHALTPIGLSSDVRKTLATIFSGRLGRFRSLWDALNDHFEDTGNSTCPYCNFGEQWEHDHYLPKSIFPEFTLYPKNLVPICKPCNGKKLARYHETGSRLFIYALSELSGIDGLLQVDTTYLPKLTVSYSLANPGTLDDFMVLERHFQALDLGRRYTKQASTTIALLLKTFRSSASLDLGPRKLQRRLRQMARDRKAQCPPNHWEVALLQHLSESVDFVNYVYS